MPNKVRGEMEVKVGGKLIKLVPSFVGIAEIEDRAGKGILTLCFEFQKGNIGLGSVAAILYGGMVGSEELKFESYDDFGNAVRKTGVVKLSGVASAFLLQCAKGEVEDEKPEAVEKPKPKKAEAPEAES